MSSNFSYNILEECLILRLTPELATLPFSCGDSEGDKDLDDFFHNQALPFSQEKLGQTYCVIDNNGEEAELVAFFTPEILLMPDK